MSKVYLHIHLKHFAEHVLFACFSQGKYPYYTFIKFNRKQCFRKHVDLSWFIWI